MKKRIARFFEWMINDTDSDIRIIIFGCTVIVIFLLLLKALGVR